MTKFKKALREELDALQAEMELIHRQLPVLWRAVAKPAVHKDGEDDHSEATVEVSVVENQISPGEECPVTVTVTGDDGIPGGQVTLYDNGVALEGATQILEQGATVFKLTFPFRSRHMLAARYGGDEMYAAEPTSNGVRISVI